MGCRVVAILLAVLLCASLAYGEIAGYERDTELSNKVNTMLKNLHKRTMPFLSEVLSTMPTTETLPQGWAAVSKDTTPTYSLHFNIEGAIRSVYLTDIS